MRMTTTNATDFLKSAIDTAEFFGFRSPDELKKHPDCKRCKERVESSDSAADRKQDDLHGLLTAGLSAYGDARLNGLERPSLFYSVEKVPRSGDAAIGLHVFGVEKSIAEAILIQTIRSLLSELGHNNHCLLYTSDAADD